MAGRRKYTKKKAKRHYKRAKKAYRAKKRTRRALKGFQKISISSKHLKKRPQTRFIDYTQAAILSIANGTWGIVWATTGVDASAARYLPTPYTVMDQSDTALNAGGLLATINQIQAELDDNGIVGREWDYKYIDLRFTVNVYPTANPTATQYDWLRLVIIQNKSTIVPLTDFTLLMTSIDNQIVNRDWRILLDKQWCMCTGLGATVGAVSVLTVMDRPKVFRFRMPFKYHATVGNAARGTYPNSPWAPPLNTYVLLFSKYGQVYLQDCRVRFYFTC